MKKIIVYLMVFGFSVSLFAASKVHAQEIQNTTAEKTILYKQAQEFAAHCIQTLAPQELQLLANVMCYSCAFAFIDHQVRSYNDAILTYAHLMHNEVHAYQSSTETQEKLTQMLAIIKNAVTTRHTLYACWDNCIKYCEQDNSPAFMTALETWQNTVQQYMLDQAQEGDKKLIKTLRNKSRSYDDPDPVFYRIEQELAELEHENPAYTFDDTQNSFISITKAAKAHELGVKGQRAAGEKISHFAQLKKFHNELQAAANEIMIIYFQALQEHLKTLDPLYNTMMFNPEGLIPEEQRIENLPSL